MTSTLAISSEPRLPSSEPKPDELEEPEKGLEEQKHLPDAVENGIESVAGDRDEVMAEVVAEINDDMTIDMEAFREIVASSDTNVAANSDS